MLTEWMDAPAVLLNRHLESKVIVHCRQNFNSINSTANMSKLDYIKLVNGSFDAGLLIDSSTGVVLHANDLANALFGFSPHKEPPTLSSEDHLTFWTHSMVNTPTHVVTGDTMVWKDVVETLQQEEGSRAPVEWKITGTTQEEGKDFPGLAKLTMVKDYTAGAADEAAYYVVGTFRHVDDHESSQASLGGVGSASINVSMRSISEHTREAGTGRRRRSSFMKEVLLGESSTMLSGIDSVPGQEEMQRRMSSFMSRGGGGENDTFSTSISNAVQRESIMTAIVEASLDPLFQINEAGIVQMMNKAAITTFGFERDELLGENISKIVGGGHAKDRNKYIQRYLATGDTRVIGKRRDLLAVKNDGTEFPIELAIVEVDTFLGDERIFCGYIRDLSTAKAAERITKGILESSLDAMIQIDLDGSIEMVNEAAISIFGWSREEIVVKNVDVIVSVEHASNHDSYLKEYKETGVAYLIGKRRELNARKRDGSEFPIELYVVEVKGVGGATNKYCGFLRDLTDAKAKEEAILNRERRLHEIINASLDPLFQIGETGIIQDVNTAACSLFGYTVDELCGSNISIIVGAEHASSHDMYLKRYLETGVEKVIGKRRELKARKRDGTEFSVELSVVEIATDAGIERQFCGFVSDLTERKKLMEVTIEKTAAEVLLMNVLPEQIANQLLRDPSHIAESHKCACILFADIVGFTAMSSKMMPKEVVSMLNDLFSMFDGIVEEYCLNKVKTIGDCVSGNLFCCLAAIVKLYSSSHLVMFAAYQYMVTCVPPKSDNDKNECANVCHFALDMLVALHTYNSKFERHNLNLRIGLNIGEVVVGVVGTKRFLYDVSVPMYDVRKLRSHEVPFSLSCARSFGVMRSTQPREWKVLAYQAGFKSPKML
jgi:PAS domain S-box-containing protein